MISIFKYKLTGIQYSNILNIEMPRGAKILSIGEDPLKDLCIWAQIDTKEEMVNRKILCWGTGWPLEDALAEFPASEFVGTVIDGPYMWHIFDTKVEEEIE